MAIVVPDDVWNELRKRCCSSRPWTEAKAVVMVRQRDIVAAVKAADKLNASRDCAIAEQPTSCEGVNKEE